jgi:hypothetical protein
MGVSFKIEKRRNRCPHLAESFPVSLRFLILKEIPRAPSQTPCLKIRHRIYDPEYQASRMMCPVFTIIWQAASNDCSRTRIRSVSKVEIAKILKPASAKGTASEDRTPTNSKGNGPTTWRALQSRSATNPGGKLDWPHTTESSVGVRVTDQNWPEIAHGGMESPGRSLQIANFS